MNTRVLSTVLVVATAVTGVLLLGACSTTGATAPASSSPAPAVSSSSRTAVATSTARSAHVMLTPASGSLVSGKLVVIPMGHGVHITGEIGGLQPGGTHAIHIHEKGDCSAADATSAGGHFNPGNQPHGRVGAAAHHGGDMDNIVANANGIAQVDVHADGVTLGGGAANDINGRAIVVHAKADDYVTQPAGNAGTRVACGVIRAD